MRATALQAAVVAVLAGLLLILAGVTPPRPEPAPTTSWRPATEQERRESDRELLIEELDRLRQER